MLRTIAFALALSFATAGPAAADPAGSPTVAGPDAAPEKPAGDPRQDRLARVRALPWKDVHDMPLPASGARLSDMPGFAGLSGENARTFRSIVQGGVDPTIEGDVLRRNGNSEVIFSWHKVGYVDAKDFSEIDADKLLASVREATFAANDDGARAGLRPIKSVDWLRKPTWNDTLRTAFWMLEGVHDDGEHTVNPIALKLGRRGYEKMVWVTTPDQIGRADDLALAMDAHKFPSGDRYEDHAAGDKVAAFGIAGLVAGVIGLKAAKVAGIGALLLLFKKFALLLLVPFIWIGNKLKGLFGRRRRTIRGRSPRSHPDRVDAFPSLRAGGEAMTAHGSTQAGYTLEHATPPRAGARSACRA